MTGRDVITLIALLSPFLILTTLMAHAEEQREMSYLADSREEYAPYVRYSVDGKKVIYASRRLRTGELDAFSGELGPHRKLYEPSLFEGHCPREIQLVNNGTRILTSDIKIWDIESGEVITAIPLKTTGNSVDISDDGKSIVVAIGGPGEGMYFLVDEAEKKTVLSASGVVTVRFSPNSKLIAEGHEDGTVRIWEVASGKKLFDLKPPKKWRAFSPLAFSPDNKTLAAGSGGDKVRIWNLEEKKDIFLEGLSNDMAFSFAFSPDGKKFAAGTFDGDIYVWTLGKENKLLHKLTGHEWVVHSLCFSPNGESLVSGSYDGTIRSWDVQSGEEHWRYTIEK